MHSLARFANSLCPQTMPLLILYAVLSLLYIKNAPFLHDDGAWIWAASNIAERGAILTGCLSSRGFVPHSPLGAYLYAFFYWIYPGIYSVIAGVLFINVCTQWMIIRLGRALGRPLWGYVASLLFFFSPTFFVFLAPRTWQVTFLPFFFISMVYCLVRLCSEQGRWWHLTLSCACWACALNLHFSAILLGPVLILPLFFYNILSRISMRHYVASIAVVVFCSSLHLAYFFARTGKGPLVIAFYALGLLFLLGLRKACISSFHFFSIRKLEYPSVLVLAGVPLITISVISLLTSSADTLTLLIKYLGMLASNSALLAEVTGIDTGSGWKAIVFGTRLSPEGILWGLYILLCLWAYPRLETGEKIVFIANLFPAIFLLYLPLILNEKRWEIYWPYALFLFPAPFLGISRMLVWKPFSMRTFSSACDAAQAVLLVIVVGFNVIMSQYFAMHVKKTGGENMYFSTIGIKETVMEYIFQSSDDPCIILVYDKSTITSTILGRQGLWGWQLVAIETRKKQGEQQQVVNFRNEGCLGTPKPCYYILESEAAFIGSPQQLANRIESGGPFQKMKFKSVTLYISNFHEKTLGDPVTYNFDVGSPAKFIYAR